MRLMEDTDLTHKRVMIREDLNVPIADGSVTSDVRIQAALPTLQQALKQKAAVMVLSHLGRPIEGTFDTQFSLQPVADRLSELLKQPVILVKDWINGIEIKPGEVVLCENVRFNVGEKANDLDLSKRMAALCDVFVMDAFATAHRAQASTCGVAQFAKQAVAGPLLAAELYALKTALYAPNQPVVAIVAGSKVSTKLAVLKHLLNKVDHLIVGGGIANTFLKAAGFPIGKSLCENEFLETAKQLLSNHNKIPLPTDVVVAKTFSDSAEATVKAVKDVAEDDMILDIGPETAKAFSTVLDAAGTIVWNGPVGVFEMAPFANGTQAMAEAIAASSAFSIAGGGDTLAAIEKFDVHDDISYLSTGGGAFLEMMEGKTLPGVATLED